jgi:hypothetical protein
MFGRTKRASDAGPLDLRCSFCNKSDRDVRKLIAGRMVFICDECVDVCVDIIATDAATPAAAVPEPPFAGTPPWPAKIRCALCRMPLALEEALAVPDRGIVCGPCIAAVRATALAAEDAAAKEPGR